MEHRRWQTKEVESLQNWKEVNVGAPLEKRFAISVQGNVLLSSSILNVLSDAYGSLHIEKSTNT